MDSSPSGLTYEMIMSRRGVPCHPLPKLDTPLGFQLPKKSELVPREANFMPGAQTDLTPSSQEIRVFRAKAEGFSGSVLWLQCQRVWNKVEWGLCRTGSTGRRYFVQKWGGKEGNVSPSDIF